MSLLKLVILLEDVPGLGTRFPGYQHPPGHEPPPYFEGKAKPSGSKHSEHGRRTLVAAALDSVRLYQLGLFAGGELRSLLSAAAEKMFRHAGCNAVPLRELYELIVGDAIPPPSIATQLVTALTGTYMAATNGNPLSSKDTVTGVYNSVVGILCPNGPCVPLLPSSIGLGHGPHTRPPGELSRVMATE